MVEWWVLPLWWLSGAASALLANAVVSHKRPKKCPNCARRPSWAFDRSPRGSHEILRDHMKECIV